MKISRKRVILQALLSAIILLSSTVTTKAQEATTLFPYPTITDENATLTERCNYLVYNFWARCNIKQSFSTLQRLNEAFGVWASFMPYATADTVHMAIDNYIKAVEKQSPKNIADVGQMARNWFYCDTAQYMSEELFIPFCQAVIDSKKVPAAVKGPYQRDLKVIQSSSVGQRVPGFVYTRRDGSKGNFDEALASRIILLFSTPDCIDCRLLKARLAADYYTKELINLGLIKIVVITPEKSNEAWAADAASYPDTWEVGATDDVNQYFDLGEMPTIYWLDGRHKVLGKDVNIDGLLYLVQQIYANTKQ